MSVFSTIAENMGFPNAGKAVGKAFRQGAAATYRAAKPLGRPAGKVAMTMAAAPIAFAAGAGMIALGVAHGAVGNRPLFQGHREEHLPGRIPSMPRLSGFAERRVVGAGLLASAGGGYQDTMRRRWGVSTSNRMGTPEMERSDFMGATGSLCINSSRRNDGSVPGQQDISRMAGVYADDVLVLAARVAGRRQT